VGAVIEPPRITGRYRLGGSAYLVGIVLPVGMFTCIGLIALLHARAQHQLAVSGMFIAIVLGGLALIAAILFAGWRQRQVTEMRLDGTSLTLRSWFGSRQLAYADIAGRRGRYIGRNRRVVRTLLVPVQGAGWPVFIPLGLQTDATFSAWLAQVPDLDQADLHAPSLPQAQRLTLIFKLVSVALALAVLIIPAPPVFVLAAACGVPLAAIALARFSGGLVAVSLANRPGRGPGSALGPIVVSLAFWLRLAGTNPSIMPNADFTGLALGGAVAALLSAAGYVLSETGLQRPGAALVALLSCGVFTYSAAMYLNCCTDTPPPTAYAQRVTDKFTQQGRKSLIHYFGLTRESALRLSSPHTVSAALYDATRIGDEICALAYPGRLGVGWYRLARCDAPAKGY